MGRRIAHACLAAALRVFRRIVGLKDEYFNKHIIRHELIVPIFECYRRNGHTYNLLNSALLELFEFIRTENIRSLLLHVGKYAYEQPLGDIAYVDTFKQLRTRFEQFTEAATASGGTVTTGHVATRAHTPDWKQREDEWFNEDDEEWADDLPHVNVQQEQKRLRTVADSIFHHQSGGAGMYSSTSAKRRDSMQLMAPGTEPKRPAVATMDDNDENTIVLTREEQEEEDQAIARVERLPSMAAVRRQRDEDDGVDVSVDAGDRQAQTCS
jgi:protein phosphatase-4 regulatory subunit 3